MQVVRTGEPGRLTGEEGTVYGRSMPSEDSAARTMIVVAAVLRDAAGRILLTRRREGSHMGGLWEFPGGKVEEGESPAGALERELEEELAVRARIGPPMSFAVHEEPGLRIILLFFSARLAGSVPVAAEGQEIAWVEPDRLGDFPTPPADAALVELLVREAGVCPSRPTVMESPPGP